MLHPLIKSLKAEHFNIRPLLKLFFLRWKNFFFEVKSWGEKDVKLFNLIHFLSPMMEVTIKNKQKTDHHFQFVNYIASTLRQYL
jgi:hypothetical protein